MKMNTRDLFSLQGKTAIVTGGGRGLGEQIAEAYGDAGVVDGGTSASVQ
jgi:gluconate 5-dehydrogenase